ncbi:CamS family sex pheromone protein [Apilactobacillus apisilvae]|uniref:CamS family sex pheromone protein n=1 Tax=Apilactobacillus apisilvae TaxID=2923364 RepID=A0ABY4PK37_9LACO|nr:CamS family sex pheromone protein [Apilactobacillus apisilvae]UQS85726.1 CamS family sex pheromone protein [Apilactobacillus apisilvae]
MFTTVFLAACGNNKNNNENSSSGTQVISQTNSNYYQGVIKKGHYLTSKSRGVSVQQNDNQLNLKGFENGLLSISKDHFPTDDYILQEGQYINTDTVENWLGRKSKSNPDGLNPEGKDSKEPLYLQQMDEQDFMTEDHDSLKIKGMTIGLGINSIYYYRKEAYGAVYQKTLNEKDIVKQGKEIADKILQRLRKRKELKNIPIVFALYKQAPNDSLVGGNFFASSVNNGNNIKNSDWKSLNVKNYVLPDETSKGVNSNDENAFENFKNQIQKFFPNLSGVTAQAHYVDGQLRGMHVNITTQFYGQSEIISFTQYVNSTANKYLPNNIPIDIQISSTEGMQSFLSRKTGSNNFYTHVFTSY